MKDDYLRTIAKFLNEETTDVPRKEIACLLAEVEELDETLANSDFLLEHARIRCKEEIQKVKELGAAIKLLKLTDMSGVSYKRLEKILKALEE